jgi:hypothetical protein
VCEAFGRTSCEPILGQAQSSLVHLGVFVCAIDEQCLFFIIYFVPRSLIVFIGFGLLAISNFSPTCLSLYHVYLLDTIYWGGLFFYFSSLYGLFSTACP